jgi:hypothetical protein
MAATIEQGITDLDRIKACLGEHRHLLDKIPVVGKMTFIAQFSYPEPARQEKLLVGRTTSGNSIYAYMVLQQSNPQVYMIRYYAAKSSFAEENIPSKEIGQHDLLDPFSKIYPREASPQQLGRHIANLSCMVKFYFVAKGIAEGIVLIHKKTFLRRLKPALEAGAVKTSEAIANGDLSPEILNVSKSNSSYPPAPPTSLRLPAARRMARKSAPSLVPHSLTSLATLGKPGPSSPIPNGSSFAKTAPSVLRPTPMPPPGTATKRRAEDPDFAKLSVMVTKVHDLTSQVSAIDHDLEKLAMETSTLVKKRGLIDTERTELKAKFRRYALSSTVE